MSFLPASSSTAPASAAPGLCPSKPITSLEELLDFDPSYSFPSFIYRAYDLNTNKKSNKNTTSHISTPESQFLVCHDFRNNYLKDQFIFQHKNSGVDYFTPYKKKHDSKKLVRRNTAEMDAFYPDGKDLFSQFFIPQEVLDSGLISEFCYFSHHLVSIPPTSWTNLCHRFGVKSYGTFITEWEGGRKICEAILSNDVIMIRVAEQLVDIAEYFNFDGWLINIENEVRPDLVPKMEEFLQKVKDLCAEQADERNMVKDGNDLQNSNIENKFSKGSSAISARSPRSPYCWKPCSNVNDSDLSPESRKLQKAFVDAVIADFEKQNEEIEKEVAVDEHLETEITTKEESDSAQKQGQSQINDHATGEDESLEQNKSVETITNELPAASKDSEIDKKQTVANPEPHDPDKHLSIASVLMAKKAAKKIKSYAEVLASEYVFREKKKVAEQFVNALITPIISPGDASLNSSPKDHFIPPDEYSYYTNNQDGAQLNEYR